MLPGSDADVGAPVAADLRLVVHAAQAHAHELAPGRLGDALAERGLADAGRADEAQDRALARGIELAHREVLEDALLDLVEAVVVLVEDAPRLGDVDRGLGAGRPTAARSASRDRCASSSTRRRPRACARGASTPCAPASRLPRASSPRRSRSRARRSPPRLSSPSPSSFWIVRICSRSRCLRWLSSIDSRVRSSISRETFSTSMRCASSSSSLSSRALRSKVSSSACFSSAPMSIRPAMKSASRAGLPRPAARRPSPRAPAAAAAGSRARAALSAARAPLDVRVAGAGLLDELHPRDRERIAVEELQHAEALHALADRVVRAVRRGDVAQHVGASCRPSAGRPGPARPTSGLLCSRMPSGRCRRTASCTAARERSRPTVSGNTMPGNSTTLRTGTMISASSGSGRDGASRAGRVVGGRLDPLLALGAQRIGMSGGSSSRSWAFLSPACAAARSGSRRVSSREPASSAPRAAGCAARKSRRESPAAARASREPANGSARSARTTSAPGSAATLRRARRHARQRDDDRRPRARPRTRRPAAPTWPRARAGTPQAEELALHALGLRRSARRPAPTSSRSGSVSGVDIGVALIHCSSWRARPSRPTGARSRARCGTRPASECCGCRSAPRSRARPRCRACARRTRGASSRGRLLVGRRHHPARPAPRRPEVDDQRQVVAATWRSKFASVSSNGRPGEQRLLALAAVGARSSRSRATRLVVSQCGQTTCRKSAMGIRVRNAGWMHPTMRSDRPDSRWFRAPGLTRPGAGPIVLVD